MTFVKTHKLPGQTKLTNRETSNLNFRLTSDQVILETVANLCASQHRANSFFRILFSIFELEGITKHFLTGPTGNSEFCFPETSPRLHLREY